MTRRSKIDLDDILHLPYCFGGTDPATGVDCLWATRQALLRVYPKLEPDEMPLAHEAAIALARGDSRGRWRKVTFEHGPRIGDVLFGERPEPWVAVMADLDGHLAFTALPKLGTRLISVRRLGAVSHVLRRSS